MPMTSLSWYPNIRSAAGFQNRIAPVESMRDDRVEGRVADGSQLVLALLQRVVSVLLLGDVAERRADVPAARELEWGQADDDFSEPLRKFQCPREGAGLALDGQLPI